VTGARREPVGADDLEGMTPIEVPETPKIVKITVDVK
jgi:hypothetical protein